MRYLDEFPDFDPATMPAIPAGFEDQSWHNDVCPSFWHEANRLRIWIDYANPRDREDETMTRFALVRTDEECTHVADIVHSDDWADILAAIDEVSK